MNQIGLQVSLCYLGTQRAFSYKEKVVRLGEAFAW